MIPPADVRRAILPLRLVFWGGLLCVLDFTFATGEVSLDILNDFVGMILITVGVAKLLAIEVHARYRTAMIFVLVVSIIESASALVAHVRVAWPEVLHVAFLLYGVLPLAAIIVFCLAMRWFCLEADLRTAAKSWWVTTILFAVIYALPLGGLWLASLVAVATGESFHVDLGPAALVLVLVFLVPLVHFFISTSRMKRGAEEAVEEGEPVGPPVPLAPPPLAPPP